MPEFVLGALLLAGVLVSAPATAETVLQCEVATVHDGDSMRVKCPGERNTLRVRMHQIDAPELDQAHGLQSRDELRRLCPRGSRAIIRSQGRDQYGRLLGDVTCGDTNVNEAMVAAGAAWVYDRHVQDRRLYDMQNAAKTARKGLWRQADPTPPWRWRYQHR